MKKFLFCILAILLAAVSCSKENFNANPDIQRKKVTSTFVFESSIIKDAVTKTYLSEEDSVYWSVGDTITVFDATGLRGSSVPLTAEDINEDKRCTRFTVTFSGDAAAQPPFYAIYGLADVIRNANGKFEADIPAYQTYNEKGFSDNENPSYAECTQVDSTGKGFFKFENLCGILNVRIPKKNLNDLGEVAYAQIFNRGEVFTGIQSQGYLSGRFQIINPQTQEQAQTGIPGVNYKKILSRNLGAPDGGGMRNKAIRGNISPLTDGTYSFNFIVPVGSFSNGFKIVVAGTNGEFFQKTYRGNDCVVERGIIKQITIPVAISPIMVIPSAENSANSFIVPAEQGLYEIPVEFKGNGAQGNITDGSAEVTDDYSKGRVSFGAGSYPAVLSDGNYSAEVIWQTKNNNERVTEAEIISMDSFVPASKDSRPVIRFYRTGAEGNALIALKNGDDIVWSWHIWVTETAESAMEFTLGDYVVMDRNLGAQSNLPSEGIMSYGQQYQYGRKDPFGGANKTFVAASADYYDYAITYPADAIKVMNIENGLTTEESILHPNYIVRTNAGWQLSTEANFGWSSSQKTLWDPCPYGWLVGDATILGTAEDDGLVTMNYGGEFVPATSVNPGYLRFQYNNNYLYFPAAGKGEVERLVDIGTTVYMWIRRDGKQAKTFQCSNSSCDMMTYNTNHSLPVRCMKWDEPSVVPPTPSTDTTTEGTQQ